MAIFGTSKLINPPDENVIELTFFGPGFGESILIHVPQIGWGVVDSCCFTFKKKE